MLTYKEYKDRSVKKLQGQIRRGHEIKAEDERLLTERKVIRSHYDLPEEDMEALATASQYDVMVQIRAEEGDKFFDEEE